MVIGTVHLGEVDQVPGLFSVKTKFLIIGVPIAPLGSYLILDGTQMGVQVPLSGKSVLFGYLRIGLLVASVFVLVLGLPPQVRAKFPFAPYLSILGMIAMWVVAWKSKAWTHASKDRALELAAIAGIEEEAVEESLSSKGKRAKRKTPVEA